MIRAAVLSLGLLSLAGCGFTPVYGSSEELDNTGPISIAEIQGRAGHFLRQELIRTIGQGVPGIKGEAQLEVKLGLSIERLAFTPDQAASRSDYVGLASWTLRAPDGTILQTGVANERASFNFADSAYADIAAQSAAQERVATLLARAIRERMTMQVGNAPSTQEAAPPPRPPVLPGSTTPRPQVIQ